MIFLKCRRALTHLICWPLLSYLWVACIQPLHHSQDSPWILQHIEHKEFVSIAVPFQRTQSTSNSTRRWNWCPVNDNQSLHRCVSTYRGARKNSLGALARRIRTAEDWFTLRLLGVRMKGESLYWGPKFTWILCLLRKFNENLLKK